MCVCVHPAHITLIACMQIDVLVPCNAAPGAPLNVTLTAQFSSSVEVTWTPPSGGSDDIGFSPAQLPLHLMV